MTKKAHWVQGGAKQVGEEQLRTLLSNSTVIGFAGGTPANASFGTLGNADAEFSGGYNLKTKKDFDFNLLVNNFVATTIWVTVVSASMSCQRAHGILL